METWVLFILLSSKMDVQAVMRPPPLEGTWDTVKIHLIQANQVDMSTSAKKKYRDKFFLHGNTAQGHSVSIQVKNFYPYFMIRQEDSWTPQIIEDFIITELNKTKRFDNQKDPVVKYEIVMLKQLIGYDAYQDRPMIRIYYESPNLWYFQLKPRLEQGFSLPGSGQMHVPIIYHDDWNMDLQWLHDSGQKLQSWVNIPRSALEPVARPLTSSTNEFNLDWNPKYLKALEEEQGYCHLACTLYIQGISREGVITKRTLKPDATQPHDMVLQIMTVFYWIGQKPAPAPDQFRMFHTLQNPKNPQEEVKLDDDIATYHFTTERDMLQHWRSVILREDPDIFIHFPDTLNALQYLTTRLKKTAHKKDETSFSRFPLQPIYIRKSGAIIMGGRSIVDFRKTIEKIQGLSMETYDLPSVAHEPFLVPPSKKTLPRNFQVIKNYYTSISFDPQKEGEILRDYVDILVFIERFRNEVAAQLATSHLCSCPLTEIMRGACERNWCGLRTKCYHMGFFVNRENLHRPYVTRPASFDRIPHPPNLRPDPGIWRFKKGLTKDTIINGVNVSAKERERKQLKNTARKMKNKQFRGGVVYQPFSWLYLADLVFGWDFKSLYPSIIAGYVLCYSNVILDEKWTRDPNTKIHWYLVDHKRNTCVGVAQVDPEKAPLVVLIKELLADRYRVKGLMKKARKAGNHLLADIYDSQQLACKITQNGMYGFLSATIGARLSYMVLSALVCAIGGWMSLFSTYLVYTGGDMSQLTERQKAATTGVEIEQWQKGEVVYGDTDSVFVKFLEEVLVPEGSEPYEVRRRIANFRRHQFGCAQLTKIFPNPNEMEMEKLMMPYLATDAMKRYAAGVWESPQKMKKIDIKGMVNRSKCPFVRRLQEGLIYRVLQAPDDMVKHHPDHHITSDIKGYLTYKMEQLFSGKIPMEDMTISVLLKRPEEYKDKSGRLIQVETARRIKERTGVQIEPGTRMTYVVVKPAVSTQKHYLNGEDPKYAEEEGLSLNIHWYLKSQIQNPLSKILFYQGCPVKVPEFLRPYLRRAAAMNMSRSKKKKTVAPAAHQIHVAKKQK